MSSDEESPQELQEKKQSRRSSVDGKKKKSSRRKSAEEGGEEKKKKKKKKPSDVTEVNIDIDKDTEKANDEVKDQKIRQARQISFSGSVTRRLEIKDKTDSLADSTDSLNSALKPSKYRSGSSGDSIISDIEQTQPSSGDVPQAQAPDASATERRKLMFKRAAGADATNGTDTKAPISSLPIHTPAGNERYPKPEPLQRRGSDLVTRKSISILDTSGSGLSRLKNLKSRSTLLSGGIVGGGSDHLRRSAMSADDQIYYPPKSRYSSILQAWGHLMAGRVTELVLWTYGASFAKVMLFFLGFYVSNIFIWAFFIMGADTFSTNGNSCLYGDDAEHPYAARYEMAFELSWCTFTTVGYGAISPPGDDWGCYPLRLICALVAFIGVLFGSTTAAIMYSKLMRLLAQAQVTFSSTLCVQYGKGNEDSTVRFGQLNFRASIAVVKLNAMDLLNNSDDGEKGGASEDGYPVIEFRMVNDRANRDNSEIWDAQISGVVQLLKEQPKDGISNSRDLTAKAEGGESTLDLEKVVYYPVKLSPESHPHFSRIWYARHVLNEESPLLKREYRDIIAQDGKWDKDFNSWQEIRDCLNPFISLRITLSGTSAVSAASVYAEHVYEFDDVCVGWRFANMVYEDSNKPFQGWWQKIWGNDDAKLPRPDLMTKVDVKLLHDIVPQPGDDHEPLGGDDSAGLDGSIRHKMKFW